jgi:hypothetical protein
MTLFQGGKTMKKFWLILLSLGLVMAFSVSALAADVKFSGEYYVAGLFLKNVDVSDPAMYSYNGSTAFFYQRLRLGIDFVVSPCLRLVTRADIMERTWQPDDSGNTSNSYAPPIKGHNDASPLANTTLGYGNGDARNVDWDITYVDYTSPIGRFQVGFMPDYAWGTIWGNRMTGPTAGQIKYMVPIGPVTIVFDYAKEKENSYWIGNTTAKNIDTDFDSYRIGPIINFGKGGSVSGETGVLFIYNYDRQLRTAAWPNPSRDNVYVVQPYFKAKLGPVALQGEINYAWGTKDYENPAIDDQDISSFTAFLDGDANFGIVSVGGSFAFVEGQNPDSNKIENKLTGGRDWNPCLIMFSNDAYYTWLGAVANPTVFAASTTGASAIDGEMRNVWFGQLRAGLAPISKLRFDTSVSYAAADQKPYNTTTHQYFDRDYGWEVDVIGTYKITNNLSYILGGAYLWTGDYFQAGVSTQNLKDEYLIINKLTLNF